MGELERDIKANAAELGVPVVGLAGPERLDGPPSLDLDYTLPGARSIVSLAMPMDVDAIYAFLSKRSPSPHNVDQAHGNQRMHRASHALAEYIRSLGYRAVEVPPNNTYRRSLDPFANHPSFSHRFGAIASGIGAQGWSGNVMTKQYGASVYLGTVVTDALLESDPSLPPRYFLDSHCAGCKVCASTCAAAMFEEGEEEYVLLNGELHARGRRRGIDLCNASCFGLHTLSRDKRWSSYGSHWIREWIGIRPPEGRLRQRLALTRKGGATGDAGSRMLAIVALGKTLQPESVMDELPLPQELPEDQAECNRIQREHLALLGVPGLADPNVLTCGQCALICGPTVAETRKRYEALQEGGIVVPGPERGVLIRAADYAEAAKLRKQYGRRAGAAERARDTLVSARLWLGDYFGFEPRSVLKAARYRRRLKRAVDTHRLSGE